MGAIAHGIGVILTTASSFNADLPTHTASYDGESRSIERFYNQSIPNIVLGGYAYGDDWVIPFDIDTGTHTQKLDTFGLSLGYQKIIEVKDNTSLTLGLDVDVSYESHKSCKDTYNREYHCASLTPWKTFERKTHVEINPSYSITYTIRF